MAEVEAMKIILDWNRKVRRQATALNVRAGSVVFLVETITDLVLRLKGLLGGAASVATIKDLEGLRLPALDPALVEQVMIESPDTLDIAGATVPVVYQEGQSPQVRITTQMGEIWRALPPDQLRLPGGQVVAVCFQTSGWGYSTPTTDLPVFREEIAQSLANAAFERWTKPHLDVPDLTTEQKEVPSIAEEVYGSHAIDSSPLIAFGVILESNGRFTAQWFRSRSEAERAREHTVQAAASAQAETRRRRLESEAATILRQQLDSGEAISNFEAWNRSGGMTNNGHGWVIQADGSLRPHDVDDVRRFKSDGNYRWNVVSRDELALRWSCGHIGDVDGNSKFEVVKLPVDGCTLAQLEAVRKIEQGIGASLGMFGLDPEVNARREMLLADISKAVTRTPGGTALEWDYESLKQACGTHGRMVPEENAYRLIKSGVEFSESCDGREAQVVRTYAVGAVGLVEALVFDKYGTWNLSLRYRKLREGEELPKMKTEPQVRAGLQGLFGGEVGVLKKKK